VQGFYLPMQYRWKLAGCGHMTDAPALFLSGIGHISIYLYDSAHCDAEVEHTLVSLKNSSLNIGGVHRRLMLGL